jgi:hypothetical protein
VNGGAPLLLTHEVAHGFNGEALAFDIFADISGPSPHHCATFLRERD